MWAQRWRNFLWVVNAGQVGPVLFFVLAGFFASSASVERVKRGHGSVWKLAVRRFFRLWPMLALFQFVSPQPECPNYHELSFISMDFQSACNIPSWTLICDFKLFLLVLVVFEVFKTRTKTIFAFFLVLFVAFVLHTHHLVYTTIGTETIQWSVAQTISPASVFNEKTFQGLLNVVAPNISCSDIEGQGKMLCMSIVRGFFFSFLLQFSVGTNAARLDVHNLFYFAFTTRGAQYVLGVLFGIIYTLPEWRRKLESKVILWFSVAAMIFLSYYYILGLLMPQFTELNGDLQTFLCAHYFNLFGVVFGLFVINVANPKSRGIPIVRNIARFVSAVSFCGYMVNLLVAFSVGAANYSSKSYLLVLGQSLVITCLAGALLHVVVELPFSYIGKRFFRLQDTKKQK
jgi:peptidoglycan/LPS O-acetylase OafA/YrhL